MRAFGISFAFMATLTLTAVVGCEPSPANSGGRAVPLVQDTVMHGECYPNGVCCYWYHLYSGTAIPMACVATRISIEPGEIDDGSTRLGIPQRNRGKVLEEDLYTDIGGFRAR